MGCTAASNISSSSDYHIIKISSPLWVTNSFLNGSNFNCFSRPPPFSLEDSVKLSLGAASHEHRPRAPQETPLTCPDPPTPQEGGQAKAGEEARAEGAALLKAHVLPADGTRAEVRARRVRSRRRSSQGDFQTPRPPWDQTLPANSTMGLAPLIGKTSVKEAVEAQASSGSGKTPRRAPGSNPDFPAVGPWAGNRCETQFTHTLEVKEGGGRPGLERT